MATIGFREVCEKFRLEQYPLRPVHLDVETDGLNRLRKTPEGKKTVPSAAKAALILMHLCTA